MPLHRLACLSHTVPESSGIGPDVQQLRGEHQMRASDVPGAVISNPSAVPREVCMQTRLSHRSSQQQERSPYRQHLHSQHVNSTSRLSFRPVAAWCSETKANRTEAMHAGA